MISSTTLLKTVDYTTTIKSFGGNDYFLIEVIVFILKHLKDLLLALLRDGVRQMKSTHFDWVITVPGIWKAKAKRMMREKAYTVHSVFIFLLILFHCLQAGLTSDKPGITTFTPVGRGLDQDHLKTTLKS